MPKFEPKQIQRDLEKGALWPVYWIYGSEQMKIRELVKRIKTHVVKDSGQIDFSSRVFEGADSDARDIVDEANSPSLLGGIQFVLVKEAHLLKNSEALMSICENKASPLSVVVCVSKDLDQRKKMSKLLIEHAAVVECADVPEVERDAWIDYLAKRKSLVLSNEVKTLLKILDPWSLDLVEMELEKTSLLGGSEEAITGAVVGDVKSDVWIHAFFTRDKNTLLNTLGSLSQIEIGLPLLGLTAWYLRILIPLKDGADMRSLKVPPFLQTKITAYSKLWKKEELLEMNQELLEVDFSLKQTALWPLGLWSEFIRKF